MALRCQSMDVHRESVAERLVWTAFVVQIDRLMDQCVRITLASDRAAQAVLLLEDPVESLGLCIFITMIFLGHTDLHPGRIQSTDVRTTTILDASVRMMNHPVCIRTLF